MALYTIDPYYSNQFYNECKEALKNNNIDFNEYINIKPPYNWYFELKQEPIIVNYDKATNSEERWMVGKVNALRPNEEYLLLRRDNDNGQKALLKFVENEPMREARKSDYAVFFTIKNKEDGLALSKDFPGKIWYLGKYYNNRFRLCLCTHKEIKGFLNEDEVLLESSKELSEPGRFESELNWKVFRLKDRLVKFTETPYFENGIFNPVKIKGSLSGKFNI